MNLSSRPAFIFSVAASGVGRTGIFGNAAKASAASTADTIRIITRFILSFRLPIG